MLSDKKEFLFRILLLILTIESFNSFLSIEKYEYPNILVNHKL